MKKIIFILLLIFSFSGIASSNFSTYTNINSGFGVYQKPHGARYFYAAEDYYLNPFAGSIIQRCSGNNCPSSFYVNGIPFWVNHSLYRRVGQNYRGWVTDSRGIRTLIRYIENTYNTTGAPRQRVKVRKYYMVPFNYDTTPPTCGELVYYDDEQMTRRFDYRSGWINKEKYFTLVCKDPETGCKKEDNNRLLRGQIVSNPEVVSHMVIPTVSFGNNVGLRNNACKPNPRTYSKIKYDKSFVEFGLKIGASVIDLQKANNRNYINGNTPENDNGTLEFDYNKDFSKLADENNEIIFNIIDVADRDSKYGVSGIKNYSIELYRLSNRNHTPKSPEKVASCSKAKSFGEYNPSGTKQLSDVKQERFTCDELKKSGIYKYVLKSTDWAGNTIIGNIEFRIYPNFLDTNKTRLETIDTGKKYGNYKDIFEYKLHLRDRYDNPIFSKESVKIEQMGQGNETIYLNDISKSGTKSLTFDRSIYKTDVNGLISFNIKSYTPGDFNQKFRVTMFKWKKNYTYLLGTSQNIIKVNPLKATFLKPITGTIKVYDDLKKDWEGGPDIRKNLQRYKLRLNNVGNLSHYNNGRISLINNRYIITSPEHYFSIFKNPRDTFLSNVDSELGFDGKVDSKGVSGVLKEVKVIAKKMPVSYNLYGKPVKYELDDFSVSGCDRKTLGVKIIGTLQGDGKSAITTSEGENYTDLTKSELRAEIKKNATILTRNLQSGETVDGVKYIKGKNIVINGDLPYETLIVKDGNVIINGNLNIGNKKLGIIVLRNNYNVNKQESAGNIYITKNVEKINAYIYADGPLISADTRGNTYSDHELGKQLELYGSLFTRNTIGGAIKAGTSYLLPGGQKTQSLELAHRYDLNYLRKVPSSCREGEIDDSYSFLIKYNPAIQTNPPKGFGN